MQSCLSRMKASLSGLTRTEAPDRLLGLAQLLNLDNSPPSGVVAPAAIGTGSDGTVLLAAGSRSGLDVKGYVLYQPG
jgi:hypothetical protein